MLQKIWRFLGFGADDSNDEILTDSVTDDLGVSENTAQPVEPKAPAPAEVVPAPQFDAAMRLTLFEGVLRVFNQALPDFLAKSIDPQAQRQALSDALDASVADYLSQLETQAAAHAESMLRSASEASKAESERLMKEMELLEKQKARLNEAQLSSDRRRRALQDRTHDLEEQVGRLEAEREQYQLENRSLLNKIKLAQVQPEVIEELHKEIERLKAEGPEPRRDPADEQRIADLSAGLEVANQMYNKAVENLTGEHEQHLAARAQLDKVSSELARAQAQIEKCKAEVEELNSVKQSVEELNEALVQVKEVIAGRDRKIERLKAANKKLRDEMTELRKNIPDSFPEEPAALEVRNKEIVEDFECPDWFVSEPDPASPGLRRQPNLDFGYTEPPRKPRLPENESQLPLF